MDKKDCVINPKTNRAVKADSKIGKMILGVKTEAKKAQPKKEPVKKVEAKKEPVKKVEAKKEPVKKVEAKKEPVKKVEAKKEPVKKVEAKKEPVKKTALKQDNYIDILVENWTDDYIGILFSQQQNQKTNNIIKKIETLNKKASSVIPSDLLKLDMELKNKLFEKYVKSSNPKVGIDIIDEGMRDIIKYIDEDAKLPKEIDYKYYTAGIKEGNKKLTKNL